MSIAGKILFKVILNKLNTHLIDETVPESQYGFHQNRVTVDAIFVARQIQENARNKIGMSTSSLTTSPRRLTQRHAQDNETYFLESESLTQDGKNNSLRCIHDGINARLVNGSIGDEFIVNDGLKQGSVLVPTLFGFLLSMMLLPAFKDSDPGIQITYRTIRGIFNTQHLKAIMTVIKSLVRNLLCADDCYHCPLGRWSLKTYRFFVCGH